MTESGAALTGTAAALRREFDRAFAEAPVTHTARFESLMAVRIGGDAYSIHVSEIGGLYADRRIVPFPTTVPELLGLAGFRGQLAPVYDLASLLGYPAARAAPRWLVLACRQHTVAFAFDAFERQMLLPLESVVASSGTGNAGPTRPHLRGAVRTDDTLRPIVYLASVIDDIQERVDAAQQRTHLAKER